MHESLDKLLPRLHVPHENGYKHIKTTKSTLPLKAKMFSLLYPNNRRRTSPKRNTTNLGARIEIIIESPPLIFHGKADDSLGAILSGQLILHVDAEYIETDDLSAALDLYTKTQKCPRRVCAHEERMRIANWKFLSQRSRFPRGKHYFPFSTLIPGYHPTSITSDILTVEYQLSSSVYVVESNDSGRSMKGGIFNSVMTPVVQRALYAPGSLHCSTATFPNVPISAEAEYSRVIHPSQVNKVSLHLNNLKSIDKTSQAFELWCLEKLTWGLEEVIRVPGLCEQHDPANSNPHIQTRSLGEGRVIVGLEPERARVDGSLAVDFEYTLDKRVLSGREPGYTCSSEDDRVKHSLVIKFVLFRGFGCDKNTHISRTDNCVTLTMRCAVVLGEDPSLGASWEMEHPPSYQNALTSPPEYPAVEDRDELCEAPNSLNGQ